MHPFNKYFDKIYVLALKNDIIRQNQINHQLRGIDYEFIWGPNIREMFPNANSISDLPISFFVDFDIDREKVLHWTLGGLGCALGHRMMMKASIQSNSSKVLLLEDDIIMLEGAPDHFEQALDYIPKDWELLYLGYEYPSRIMKLKIPKLLKVLFGFLRRSNIIGLTSWNIKKSYFPQTINKYIQKSGVCLGGHAYALSNDCIKKLLMQNTPLRHYSDPLLMTNVYHQNVISYNFVLSIINQNKSIGSYTE